ncbi:MAG: hypothetical protein EA351_14715 [Gemmatimonadales bacterium]|nr:MAG: hypothetical protein EA351_14715 [Gemmatimonadales bacterium]
MTTTQSPYSVTCPACETSFPVDPSRVPVEGVRAICSTCMRVFKVDPPEAAETSVADVTLDPVRDAAFQAEPSMEPESPAAYAPPIDTEVEDHFSDSDAGIEIVDEPEEALDEVEDSDFTIEADAEPQDPVEEIGDPEFETGVEVGLEESVDETEEVEVEGAQVVEEDVDVATVDEDVAPSPVADQSLSKAAARFGRRDPHDRAKRLARVLVSDMLTYHPAQYEEAVSQGRLKEEFEEEIRLSWEEYEEQIGRELAESTDYFIEALNEILARGETLFRGVGRPE